MAQGPSPSVEEGQRLIREALAEGDNQKAQDLMRGIAAAGEAAAAANPPPSIGARGTAAADKALVATPTVPDAAIDLRTVINVKVNPPFSLQLTYTTPLTTLAAVASSSIDCDKVDKNDLVLELIPPEERAGRRSLVHFRAEPADTARWQQVRPLPVINSPRAPLLVSSAPFGCPP